MPCIFFVLAALVERSENEIESGGAGTGSRPNRENSHVAYWPQPLVCTFALVHSRLVSPYTLEGLPLPPLSRVGACHH